jgi:hypothetical protein
MPNYITPIPIDRTIIPGMWSDLMDLQRASYKTDAGGTTSLNISDSNSVAGAVLIGSMHAVNNEFTIEAGDSVGFKIRAAGGTFVRFANADGLTIKYVTSFTGNLLLLGSSRSLNLTIDNGYRAFYDKYDELVFLDKEVILSGQAPINTELYANNDVYIVVKNNTAQTVTDSFSAGLQSVGEFTFPFGLYPNTTLTSTTEMLTYA